MVCLLMEFFLIFKMSYFEKYSIWWFWLQLLFRLRMWEVRTWMISEHCTSNDY